MPLPWRHSRSNLVVDWALASSKTFIVSTQKSVFSLLTCCHNTGWTERWSAVFQLLGSDVAWDMFTFPRLKIKVIVLLYQCQSGEINTQNESVLSWELPLKLQIEILFSPIFP